MDKIIIVNNGSTSKKYALFQGENPVLLTYYEKTPDSFEITITDSNRYEQKEKLETQDFEESFSHFINLLLKKSLIQFEDEIKAVAFRIVAPGKYFQKDQIITPEFLEKLEDVKEAAPLHIENTQEGINRIKERLPKTTLIAISDSAFHASKPLHASVYALPIEYIEQYDLRRFGYHGISVQSVIEKVTKKLNGNLPENVIVCHLGGGASLTAVKNGKSIDNSMGFSPLDGIPMATRSGNLDPEAILYFMDCEDLEPHEMRDILFNKSGMLGLSGISSDTRVILKEVEKENSAAKLALDYFVYQIQKNIGSYVAVLGGLDLLIFTGSIGERAEVVRSKILKNLATFGLQLDEGLNLKNDNQDGFINQAGSPVSIAIIKTDELNQMAKNTLRLI